MIKGFISDHPHRYESWKYRLKRILPFRDSTIKSLSNWVSSAHQKYFEDFVFIHINKCGGTSVERALGIPLVNHDTALERRAKLGEKKWADRYKFTMVRDPYDRAVSHYFYQRRNQVLHRDDYVAGFENYLEDLARQHKAGAYTKFGNTQMSWISDLEGNLLVDKICKLERRDEDLKEVSVALNRKINLHSVKQNNRSGNYDELYTAKARALVNGIFSIDFERLCYKKLSA